MTSYTNFKSKLELKEAQSQKKGVVFTFGRFSPPTNGHEKLIDKVTSTARSMGFDNMIYASSTYGNDKNPLKHKDKVKFMKSAFKKATISSDPKIKNPFIAMADLIDKGYTDIVMIVGGDRVDDFRKNIGRYVNHKDPKKSFKLDSFEVMSAGERDPDATDVSGMSASKMRAFASEGDFESFLEGLPSGANERDSKKLFDMVRKGLGIREEIQRLFDSFELIGTDEEQFIQYAELSLSEEAKHTLKLLENTSNENKPTVIVLSKYEDDDDLSDSVEKIGIASEKLGCSFYPVSIDDAYIVDKDLSDSELVIHNYNGEGNKITIKTDNTIIIPRGGALTSQSGVGLLSTLQDSGAFVTNKISHMELCRNKYATALALERAGIPSPRTALVANEEAIDVALEKIGGKFPVVIKTITGAEGIGVSVVDSYASMKSVLQSLWKFDAELIIQEYLEITHDVRSIVVNGEVVASMKRNKGDKDFRTNKALGNTTEPYKLNKKEQRLIKRTAKVVGCYWCGVDHITVNGEHKVLEVNGSPGTGADSYQSYFGKNKPVDGQALVNHIMDIVTNKDNWKFSAKEIGVIEMITIKGLGKLESKADTGNGTINVLHAENIKKKNGKVTFDTEFDRTLTMDIQDDMQVNIGKGIWDKRYVVNFDVEFGGKSYKDVPFSLSDRDDNDHAVLLGKDFLKQCNYSVNVSKKFTLSESNINSNFEKLLTTK
jgi:RimK family alpha-L-glutamate ligase